MSLEVEILVPDGVVLHAEITALRAADASGQFGLLPGHETIVTLLVPCLLTYRDAAGVEHYAAADGGVLFLEGNRVSLLTREAVVADRLDAVADAAATMLRHRQEQERIARTEFAELETSLLRELRKTERKP